MKDFDVAGIFAGALQRTVTLQNAAKRISIYRHAPFNPHGFDEHDFVPSSATKIDLESTESNRSEPELGDGDKQNENGKPELVDEEPATKVKDLIPGNNKPVEKTYCCARSRKFYSFKKECHCRK